ncbi:MAG: YkgJ family cysteine cluster protein [Lachnospiraceae bacterium]|nr:YkgJ family cysteine cluster protein [Lachnospiraceae bacterium]
MNQELTEISDGRLYRNNDMVKIGCHDCEGCSSCCRNMGQSIWLDPYDAFQLTHYFGKTFEELLEKEAELHVEEGLILPNLRMIGEQAPKCSFLNVENRCSIHTVRPGICRLFPLGRNYEDEKLTYFILKDACLVEHKSKLKINKWLGVSNIKQYEKFLIEWHTLTKKLRGFFNEHMEEEVIIKSINMKFLQIFYLSPYKSEDFYEEFYQKLDTMNGFLKQLGVS